MLSLETKKGVNIMKAKTLDVRELGLGVQRGVLVVSALHDSRRRTVATVPVPKHILAGMNVIVSYFLAQLQRIPNVP